MDLASKNLRIYDNDDWSYPGPSEIHDLTKDQLAGLMEVLSGIFGPIVEAVNKVVDTLEPVIEVTAGHHAVCQHNPRCKQVPEYAKFGKPATEIRRRSRQQFYRA